jgi:hypothetical protein
MLAEKTEPTRRRAGNPTRRGALWWVFVQLAGTSAESSIRLSKSFAVLGPSLAAHLRPKPPQFGKPFLSPTENLLGQCLAFQFFLFPLPLGGPRTRGRSFDLWIVVRIRTAARSNPRDACRSTHALPMEGCGIEGFSENQAWGSRWGSASGAPVPCMFGRGAMHASRTTAESEGFGTRNRRDS